jgi:hypothetical protein
MKQQRKKKNNGGKKIMLLEIEILASDDKKIPGVINIENFIKWVISGGLA